ncbi:ankyrin, partial [Mytilinidion resinicola]
NFARLLLDSNADIHFVNNKTGNTPLTNTCPIGCKPLVSFLIDRGADVNMSTANGRTALQTAAACNHPEILPFLVKKGADIEQKNSGGSTAIALAAPF